MAGRIALWLLGRGGRKKKKNKDFVTSATDLSEIASTGARVAVVEDLYRESEKNTQWIDGYKRFYG